MAVAEAFDMAFKPGADLIHMNPSELSDAFAPELLLWAYEFPVGFLATGLFRILLGIGIGAGLWGGATLASGRDREAMLHAAAHLITHPNAPGVYGVLQASASGPQALTAELQTLRQGIASSNLDLVRAAFLFSPQDVGSFFQSAQAQFSALAAAGPAALAAAPTGAALGPAEAAVPAAGSVLAQVQSAIGYGETF